MKSVLASPVTNSSPTMADAGLSLSLDVGVWRVQLILVNSGGPYNMSLSSSWQWLFSGSCPAALTVLDFRGSKLPPGTPVQGALYQSTTELAYPLVAQGVINATAAGLLTVQHQAGGSSGYHSTMQIGTFAGAEKLV